MPTTTSDTALVVARSTSEAQWARTVRTLATTFGWASYHTYDSRRSDPGFPDEVLVRPPELLFVELKTEKGRLSAEQKIWLDRLDLCGMECHVWRPSDIAKVEARLRRDPGLAPRKILPFCTLEFHKRCRRPAVCGCACHTEGAHRG